MTTLLHLQFLWSG